MLAQIDIKDWIENGLPGSSITYHVGRLSEGRRKLPSLDSDASMLLEAAGANPVRVDEVAVPAVWRPVKVYLTQRRVMEGKLGTFEYIATHASQPYAEHAWLNPTRELRHAEK